MRKLLALAGVALIVCCCGALFAGETVSSAATTETKQECATRMAWWREARFGLFIHWGIYAVPAGEWKGLEKKEDLWGEWIMNRARIPVAEYEVLTKRFNPVKFDADQWVKTAKDAGMKYIVITAKHCDGFAMFRSQTSKYNIVDATPFRRDPMKDLREACDRQGLKLGFYYSHCWDWHEPDALGLDNTWDFPDRKKKDVAKYLHQKSMPQVREIVTQYRPSVVWFDVPADLSREQSQQFLDIIRRRQPACIVNDRVGNGLGDYTTPEQVIPRNVMKTDFEVCMTLNKHWGFDKNDHQWKQPPMVLRHLVETVGKGGNYLLNVGPTAEGLFPPDAVRILGEVGAWIKINGESIYGTTAGPFPALSWGYCTAKPGRLYLHVFDWPSDGRLLVPGIRNRPIKAYLLRDAEQRPLRTSPASDEDLTVSVPAKATDPADTVVVLAIDGVPDVNQTPLLVTRPGFTNVLGAATAEIHGETAKYNGLNLERPEYDYIGEWTNREDRLSWPFRTIEPCVFDVAVTYSSEPMSKNNEYAITIGNDEFTAKVDAGDGAAFKAHRIATVKLPASGHHVLKMTPKSIASGAGIMKLHAVTLTPVR